MTDELMRAEPDAVTLALRVLIAGLLGAAHERHHAARLHSPHERGLVRRRLPGIGDVRRIGHFAIELVPIVPERHEIHVHGDTIRVFGAKRRGGR